MPDSRMPLVIRTTGDGLRKRRLEIGLTQAQVAEILGVAEATVGNWETVKQRPSERFLPRIASFLGSERLVLTQHVTPALNDLPPNASAVEMRVSASRQGSVGRS